MSYVLLDEGFSENPKITSLTDKAYRLHVTALNYCGRNLTNGAISELALKKTGAISKIARPKTVVKQLVSAGLWHPNGDGWTIHDYLEYNPSRAEIEKKRRLARDRRRRYNQKGMRPRNASRDASGDAEEVTYQVTSKEVTLVTTDPEGSSPGKTRAHTCPHCGVTRKTQAGLDEHLENVHFDN